MNNLTIRRGFLSCIENIIERGEKKNFENLKIGSYWFKLQPIFRNEKKCSIKSTYLYSSMNSVEPVEYNENIGWTGQKCRAQGEKYSNLFFFYLAKSILFWKFCWLENITGRMGRLSIALFGKLRCNSTGKSRATDVFPGWEGC